MRLVKTKTENGKEKIIRKEKKDGKEKYQRTKSEQEDVTDRTCQKVGSIDHVCGDMGTVGHREGGGDRICIRGQCKRDPDTSKL